MFELLDCVEHVEKHFTRHTGSIDGLLRDDQDDLVRDKVSKHPHELIKLWPSPFNPEASAIALQLGGVRSHY